jgi:MscS family membrane protein
MDRRPVIGALIGWVLTAAVSLAQTTAGPRPLRPADTSSPRDTLRSFLENADELTAVYRRDGVDAAAASPARARALDTFDLGSVDLRSLPTQPLAPHPIFLLHEILNRIAIPPDDEIPGDEDVANHPVDRWTVPDTRITIARIPSGPRAGEYLFTAETASQLHASYDLVAHLPLRPGATPGIYESVVQDERAGSTLGSKVQSRLKPVDTSSPRTILRGFVDNIDRAHALVRGADAALSARPPRMSREEALDVERSAEIQLRRSAGLLDLSEVPEAHREHAGLELALALKEVLDRAGLPPWDAVPGSVQVDEWRRQPGNRPPYRWEVPNTPIEIDEGSGEFHFSARTVARIPELYDSVRDLPYRPGASEGFYEYYVSTPGYLVAQASLLGRFVEALPDGLKVLEYGQTRWQWIGLVICVLLTALALLAASRVIWRLSRRSSSPRRDWVRVLIPVAIAVIVWVVRDFVDNSLNITGTVLEAVTAAAHMVIFVAIAWAVFAVLEASAEVAVTSSRLPSAGIEPSLLRIGARILGFLAGAWVVIAGMRSLGADVVPLLAGLGIGGLAVALAAQTTLANFIGSLTLFTNKPVRVGDFCRYGERIGTVEEIGLHSTRIRSLERTVVTIPNAEFAQMQLDNLARRDRRLLTKRLHLRPETTPEQLRYVLAKLRELLVAHPMVTPEPARVRFVDYGPYSKDVDIFAYLRCRTEDDFLAIQEDILLRVEDIVTEAGTGFALPAQTSYLARDAGLDVERRHASEARVEEWRREGRLPFPGLAADEVARIADTLDYPPRGAPDGPPAGARRLVP